MTTAQRVRLAILNSSIAPTWLKAYCRYSQYSNSGQISINATTTWKPPLKKNRDEVEKHAAALREISSVNLTPEVEKALKVIEDAAKDKVHDLPFLDLDSHRVFFSEDSTVYHSFKPERIVISEQIIATYSGKGLPDMKIASESQNANDIKLSGFYSGNLNAFPSDPSATGGIHASALNDSRVHSLQWPAIRSGVPATANFIVMPTVYKDLMDNAPLGYDKIPRSIQVNIYMALFGPAVR